jgi:hypothetical protein
MDESHYIKDFLDKLDALGAAYSIWRDLTGSPYNQNSRLAFLRFLEIHETEDTWAGAAEAVVKVPSAMTKLQWLRGPNAKVMYEIWKAKKGND